MSTRYFNSWGLLVKFKTAKLILKNHSGFITGPDLLFILAHKSLTVLGFWFGAVSHLFTISQTGRLIRLTPILLLDIALTWNATG